MTTDPRPRIIEKWETAAVTALPPGWVNVYQDDDGTEYTEPSPALLLQENRVTSRRTGEHWRDEHHQPPYSTRVVAASQDPGYGWEPANDLSNYLRTEPEAGR